MTKVYLRLLHYKKHYVIDEEDKSVRILTVLPLESGDRDIRTDEKGNFGESLQLNQWTKGQKRDRWPNKQQQW